MAKVIIRCFETDFIFETEGEDAAWYELDHAESFAGNKSLNLNADREVYAVFTDEDGTERYGTVGDSENEVLADNYPCEKDVIYLFYENPRTKDYYV